MPRHAKQQNDKAATPKDAAVAGQFLSDAQQKLRDQVLALSARIQSRDLSQANEEFTGFDKDMQTAAEAMAPSAEKLKGMQWKDALPLEQKALQALLRAEATFRQIQVAFGQQGGGGEWRRKCRARSRKPLRPRTRHGKKPVRDRSDRPLPPSSTRRTSKTLSRNSMLSGQTTGRTRQPAAQSAAELPGTLAAGDVATRGRATPTPDGAACPEQSGSARQSAAERSAGQRTVFRTIRLAVIAIRFTATESRFAGQLPDITQQASTTGFRTISRSSLQISGSSRPSAVSARPVMR